MQVVVHRIGEDKIQVGPVIRPAELPALILGFLVELQYSINDGGIETTRFCRGFVR